MPSCYLVKKANYLGIRGDWDVPAGIDPQAPPNDLTGEQETEGQNSCPGREVDVRRNPVQNPAGTIPPILHPFLRVPTPEEREIAQDLLELSRSLPPRPKPTFIPLVQGTPPTAPYYYPPLTPTESPLLGDTSQEQEPPPTFTLLISSGHAEQHSEQGIPPSLRHESSPQRTPLTPSTSEYSSDAENVCPSNEDPLGGSGDGMGNGDGKDSPAEYSFEDLIVVDSRRRVTHRSFRRAKDPKYGPGWKGPGKRKSTASKRQRCNKTRPKPRRSQSTSEDDEISEMEEEDSDWSAGSGKPRFTCSECGKHYATSSNLSRHKQTHRSLDSGNARRCPTCGKAYVSMPALSMHLLTHNLVHKCDVCGKGFSRPWLLQGHLRSHTGEKPYSCSDCGKTFADRSNLRAHMQTHSLAKNYKCRNCQKSFALKSYLNKHYDSACFKEPIPSDEDSSSP